VTQDVSIGEPGEGVVDPQLRVHGIDGLRVADTSVLPTTRRGEHERFGDHVGEGCAEFLMRPGVVPRSRQTETS
jgi:choline dehydrogenase